tara:strand:- start:4603 stop:4920 length:318 start_codon:yes stop_codon:yes gene_type:complete
MNNIDSLKKIQTLLKTHGIRSRLVKRLSTLHTDMETCDANMDPIWDEIVSICEADGHQLRGFHRDPGFGTDTTESIHLKGSTEESRKNIAISNPYRSTSGGHIWS